MLKLTSCFIKRKAARCPLAFANRCFQKRTSFHIPCPCKDFTPLPIEEPFSCIHALHKSYMCILSDNLKYECFPTHGGILKSIIADKQENSGNACFRSSGGDGGIRTPGRFDPSTDFESASLRPLRYISVFSLTA